MAHPTLAMVVRWAALAALTLPRVRAVAPLGGPALRAVAAEALAESWEGPLSLLQVEAHEPQPRSTPPPKPVVWITAFARSGSSTLLSLVSQAAASVFALFEPCHEGDQLEPWLAAQGCGALLSQLAVCNFTGVSFLWGWYDQHTLRNGADHTYSPYSARQACLDADMVAFKTISWGHNLTAEVVPWLRADPAVKVLNLVRDPRSIYASMRETRGYYDETSEPGLAGLTHMCDYMGENAAVSDRSLLHVVYEDLVARPQRRARRIFEFMGAPAAMRRPEVEEFLRLNFNGDCGNAGSFSDCRGNSTEPTERYSLLSNAEYTAFLEHGTCRYVAETYHYNATPYHSSGRSLGVGRLPLLLALLGLVSSRAAPAPAQS